jgi:hypothetical protein
MDRAGLRQRRHALRRAAFGFGKKQEQRLADLDFIAMPQVVFGEWQSPQRGA